MKNKFINIRFEIKNEMDTLEKLKKEFENQEIKYLEDKENKKAKIYENENEIKDHNKYLEDLIKQSEIDNINAKDNYNTNISTLEEINKKINYELNQLKNQSTKILKSKDEYIKKRNQVKNNKRYKLDEINKNRTRIEAELKKIEEDKIKWRNDFIKYNNHCDFLDRQENDIKLNTLKEIQELYKTRNNAELELNNNQLFY
jgi:DNA repair exonuclease SbcCD ATPase subunit